MIFSLLYDLIVLLVGICLSLPGGGKRGACVLRVPRFPPKGEKKRILLYAVSVGEVKAAACLFQEIQSRYEEAEVYISVRTETGYREALRSLPSAAGYFRMPLDISFLARKLVTRLQPDVFFVIEGDLWYHLLREMRAEGVVSVLVSGKISSVSFQRFSRFPKTARKLFSLFSYIGAQNETFADRFRRLGADPASIFVTGNLKFASEAIPLPLPRFQREDFRILDKDFVIVIGSTHAPEEKEIIRHLQGVEGVVLCVVPRHPERFPEVADTLHKEGIVFGRFSERDRLTGKEKVLLIDAMGVLSDWYRIADLAVVGGSFFPYLRGHNILEPILVGTPVLFGPYMSDQQDITKVVLSAQAGKQVSLEELRSVIQNILSNPMILEELRKKGESCVSSFRDLVKGTDFLLSKVLRFRC